MNLRSSRVILLIALLLGGCQPNRSVPSTPKPYPAPTELNKKINASLQLASQYLIQHQSPDGSWRSETYGFLKDGSSLTPHVAIVLSELPQARFQTTAALDN